MTTAELITQINTMMGESYSSELLSAYILQAKKECAEWEYGLIGVPQDMDCTKYDTVVVQAVIHGLSIQGAEGETQHSENGILRGFKYTSMTDYIHAHVTPYARAL